MKGQTRLKLFAVFSLHATPCHGILLSRLPGYSGSPLGRGGTTDLWDCISWIRLFPSDWKPRMTVMQFISSERIPHSCPPEPTFPTHHWYHTFGLSHHSMQFQKRQAKMDVLWSILWPVFISKHGTYGGNFQVFTLKKKMVWGIQINWELPPNCRSPTPVECAWKERAWALAYAQFLIMKSTSSLRPVSLFSQSGSALCFRRMSACGLRCEADPLCQPFWQLLCQQPAWE